MITIFDIKFTSSEGLRKALNLWGSKWCSKVDIKDLLRMAFPELDDSAIKKNLIHFTENGIFKTKPVTPNSIYKNYKLEFGCSLPFDYNGFIYEDKKEVESNSNNELLAKKEEEKKNQQPKVEVMNPQSDEYTQIKKMLLNEIALIQDAKNYTNADGEVDQQKADMLFKRAEAINNIATSLNNMKKTEIEVKRLQLDAVRTALSHGYEVKVNGNLLGVEIK
ncbi:MAG: hypothetical protein U0M61_10185 [Succinivibrio sp.]|nr:hypothetical protein [Succinivibrio sp.]